MRYSLLQDGLVGNKFQKLETCAGDSYDIRNLPIE